MKVYVFCNMTPCRLVYVYQSTVSHITGDIKLQIRRNFLTWHFYIRLVCIFIHIFFRKQNRSFVGREGPRGFEFPAGPLLLVWPPCIDPPSFCAYYCRGFLGNNNRGIKLTNFYGFPSSEIARSLSPLFHMYGTYMVYTPTNCTHKHNYLVICDASPTCFGPHRPSSGRNMDTIKYSA
jgi:hypothetical protein